MNFVLKLFACLFAFPFSVQQHQLELEQLTVALKEKTKESRRIKSSFDTIKESNESMKKQVTLKVEFLWDLLYCSDSSLCGLEYLSHLQFCACS